MQSALALGSLLLVAGTWLLWTPQHLFPRVPLWEPVARLPATFDSPFTWALLIAWLSVTAGLVILKSRPLAWCYAVLFSSLVVLDQHRLQPWGVHISLGLLLLTSLEIHRARQWLVYLTASIYIYSALSKFDAQFLHTVGQDFLYSLLNKLGLGTAKFTEFTRVCLASGFPLGELMCGVGLLWPVTRKVALVLAILMHALLLTILGPWGLNHSWGVLLWNALFIAQAGWLLLAQSKTSHNHETSAQGRGDPTHAALARPARWQLVQWICVVMMIVPAGERVGIVDHWLGWALYAPHSSRAIIEVSESAVERLPVSLKPYLSGSDALGRRRLSVDQWSLASLGVPVYPQQRFYVGVARALAGNLEEFEIHLVLQSAANRFTGRRQSTEVNSRSMLDAAADQYWLSTQPAAF
jgi:hypothetical protein